MDHAVDVAFSSSSPGVQAIAALLVLVSLFRKLAQARGWGKVASGAGAAVIAWVLAFLGAVIDSGDVTWATLHAAFLAVGGSAAVYALAKPFLPMLVEKLPAPFAVWLKPLAWLVDKPTAKPGALFEPSGLEDVVIRGVQPSVSGRRGRK